MNDSNESELLLAPEISDRGDSGDLLARVSVAHGSHSLVARYGVSVVIAAVASVGLGLLMPLFGGDSPPLVLCALAVAAAAWWGGLGPGLLCTAISTLFAWWAFVPQQHSFVIDDPAEIIRLLLAALSGVVISVLAEGMWRAVGRQRLAIIGLTKEMLERQKVETAVRESEERLRLSLQASDTGWWQWDFTTDFLDGDARSRGLVGLPVDEPIGSFARVLERTNPEDWGRLQQRAAAMKAQPGDYEADFRVTWPDGGVHWVLAKGRSFHTAEGKPLHAMGVVTDISRQKAAEEGLAAAKVSAERAKDVAEQAKAAAERATAIAVEASRAKDHFLAVLSHELRTPLTPVVMGVSMLQDSPDLKPTVRETLEMVQRNVEMEAQLIDDLLDVTRIAQGKIELNRTPVELRSVIQRAVEVCRPDIEARKLHFGVDLGPSPPYWVDVDAARLQQVFWNLLKNAIKFTPHGGCVGIRCRAEDNHVVAEVKDSGIGIEREALLRIFNAFEQAEQSSKREFGGLGLGLAISKALVEMHGGTISARSEGRGKGATFRIRLPLLAAPVGQPDTPSSAALRQIVRPLHILLVEDHGVTAEIMQKILAAEGHTVETAGDVATALRLAENDSFDLLLSDLGLPDGSGHDLMRQLWQRGHRLPAIALSGYGQQSDIERSHQAGFAAHLTKPASRKALVKTIASIMGEERVDVADSLVSQPVPLVFDERAALQRCFGEQEMLGKMIEYFFHDHETLLPQLHSALERGDFSELGKLGHRLKGTLFYLNAELAREAAVDVERLGTCGGDRAEAEGAVHWLERECQVLKAALTEYQTASMAVHA
jgi:PAS domain S-box-containing protein